MPMAERVGPLMRVIFGLPNAVTVVCRNAHGPTQLATHIGMAMGHPSVAGSRRGWAKSDN
eukprot:1394752-Prymnesium_polylepis.1